MNKHDTLLLGCGTSKNRKALRSVLGETYNLLEAGNTRQTMILLEQNRHCIAAVLLDITAPEALDTETLTWQNLVEQIAGVPVIAITDDEQSAAVDEAFSLGASDVIPIHYNPYAMIRRIETLVELNLHKEYLEELVKEQAQTLHHNNDIMVDALSSIIEYRSVESGQHILRIRHFTRTLLEQVAKDCPEYGLTDEIISIISSAAALHDVGKIGIPDAILTKPGPLTAAERELMKTHTLIGCQILESLSDMGNQEYLRYAHNIAHYHHERWDGGGYPEGLSGDDIPICAQVVGLADVYDALTTKRVYKDAYGLTTAVNMILNGECGVFSEKLLECFKLVIPQFEELSCAYADGLSPKAERFDVTLPEPETPEKDDSLDIIQGKFQCLLHYLNAFVLEISVDRGYYHLRYNPYPELGIVNSAANFQELEKIILEQIVAPEDRQRMYDLIHTGIEEYLQAGMRRQTFWFSLRRGDGGYRPYMVTLLRANVNQTGSRSLAILCRKLGKEESAGQLLPEMGAVSQERTGISFCCRNDRDLTLVRMIGDTKTIAGYRDPEIQERFDGRLMNMIHPEDRETVRNTFREKLNQGTHVRAEFRILRTAGEPVWVMYEGRLLVEPDGQECLYSYMTDISDVMQAYDALNKKMEHYEIVLAQTENVLFDWDVENDTIMFSDTWENIFGIRPITGNVRQALREGSFVHPDDFPLLLDRIRNLESGSAYEMTEVRVVSSGGRYLWYRFRASAIRNDRGVLTRIVGLIINIDTEKQSEQALQDRAERDALTKLLNKDAGRKQTEEYLSQFPQGVPCALLIIDLDNFKQVNDSYGHLFGDTVLTKAAREIRKLFRNQDIVARIGGDEFMVLMRGVSDRTLVENRCVRLLTIFRTAFREIRNHASFGCSIGISLGPEHGTSYTELFRRADQALYRAKDLGRNTYVFFDGRDTAFLARNMRQTAVSNRIDSDDQPDLTNSGLVQYAFRRLYSSRDVDASIAEMLELIGRRTNVSRVYVFENTPDNRYCNNTYEWCNTGILPEKDNLQNVSYETDIPGYDRNFDENDLFYCSDISTLPQNLYDILAPQGIKSILHCAIRDKGVFRGYIGFDDCVTNRPWTKEQVEILTYFSEMLSVFLLKMRSQENTRRHAEELQAILDNQNAWILISEPGTYRLMYQNARSKQSAPDAEPGMLCYRALMGRDTPCPNCPMHHPGETGKTIMRRPDCENLCLTESTMIRWEGKPVCMITSRELPGIRPEKENYIFTEKAEM